MTTAKNLAITLAGTLLVSLLVIAPTTANRTSDYGADDWCNAFDSDGIGPAVPNGDDFSCDGNLATTTQISTGNGGLFTGCQTTPDGVTTVCSGGGLMSADTASGSGNYDGDWPIVDSVTLAHSAFAPAPFGDTGFSLEVTYVDISDVDTPLGPVITNECLTVAAPSITITPPAAPVGTKYSITDVDFFRSVTGCGFAPANQGARTMTATWNLNGSLSNDNTAFANVDVLPFVGIGCLVFWEFSASIPAGLDGAATGQVDFDNGLLGIFDEDRTAGGSVAQNGTVLLLPGESIAVYAAAWSVSNEYVDYDDSMTGICQNAQPPAEGLLNLDPICVAVGASTDGSTLAVDQSACILPRSDFPVGLDVPCDAAVPGPGAGQWTVVCAPENSAGVREQCHNDFAGVVAAVGVGGETEVTLSCAGDLLSATSIPADTAVGNLAAFNSGFKTDGDWSCTITYTIGAGSVHTGVCTDSIL